MSITPEVNADMVDAILAFAPKVEVLRKFGLRSIEWAVELERFSTVLNKSQFLLLYDWKKEFDGKHEVAMSIDAIRLLELEELRRTVTYHLRLERFCEGHLAEITCSGVLAALLDRLKQLRPA